MQKFLKFFCFIAIIFFLGFFLTQVLAQDVVKLPNPLGAQDFTEKDVLAFGGKVVNGFIGVTGTIALLMFIYGGFIWLTSRGEPDKIKKGKEIFIWSVVGLAIIFSSYLLVDFLIKGVTGTTGEMCCVTESSCDSIKTGDENGAKTCAAKNGTAVGGACTEVAACPGACPDGADPQGTPCKK